MSDEIDALAERANALKTAITRAQAELERAADEQYAITERLRELKEASSTPSPLLLTSDPQSTLKKQKVSGSRLEDTAIMTGMFRRLERKEAWKVALAGAAAATLFGAAGLALYHFVSPSSEPAVVASTTPPLPQPTAIVVTPPSPTTASLDNDPLPPVVTTSNTSLPPIPIPPPSRPHRRPTANAQDPFETPNPAAPGALTIVCIPKCDQVLDNGVPIGPSQIFNRPTSAGRHVLVLSIPNGTRKTMTVDVLPSQTREVRVAMDSPPPRMAENKAEIF